LNQFQLCINDNPCDLVYSPQVYREVYLTPVEVKEVKSRCRAAVHGLLRCRQVPVLCVRLWAERASCLAKALPLKDV